MLLCSCATVMPCFADKHHPVALILICCDDVELQRIVVVHLRCRQRAIFFSFELSYTVLLQHCYRPSKFAACLFLASQRGPHYCSAGPREDQNMSSAG